ncbi:MAG: hypothetical protein J6M60_03530 [Clostridia bacterium]|nr:hypothetical protein [Clostridia bacterium]
MLYGENNFIENDNIIYTIDMLRLRTDITFSEFSKLEFKLKLIFPDLIKNTYQSFGISDFKYNYNIEIGEGQSFWFGFVHNAELLKDKSVSNDNTTYNFTIEFNPNKIENKGILKTILNISNNWFIKSVDMAMDLKLNILDLCGLDKGRKKDFRMFTQGLDNRTYYMGRTNNRIKIYNKKIESNLDYDLTRVEITSKIERKVKDIYMYNYNVNLPDLYLNNYMYSFEDYKDKTTLALLYAVQSGYPINDLSRRHKLKIKSLLEGGYKINLSNEYCTKALHQCIYNIFKI